MSISIFVKCYAKVSEIADNLLTYRDRILTDTCCEDDRVNTIHCCNISAYEFSDAIAENVDGISCILVSAFSCLVEVTEIAGKSAGKSEKTRFLVEYVHNALNVQVLFLSNELHDSRIDVTGTSSHNNTFKWCKTHCCIYTFAIYNCADGRSVSKVADDNFGVVFVKAKEINSSLGYEAVGCSVETVSSYFIFLVEVKRKSVEICFSRHCLMESGIKYAYLRYAWHKLCTYTDTNEVSRVVERCKVIALFYCFDHLVCDHCGRSKFLASVYDTMSDRINLFKASDRTCLIVCKSIQYHLDCFFMCWHSCLCDLFVTSGFLVYQSSVDTDSLAETLCKYILCLRID